MKTAASKFRPCALYKRKSRGAQRFGFSATPRLVGRRAQQDATARSGKAPCSLRPLTSDSFLELNLAPAALATLATAKVTLTRHLDLLALLALHFLEFLDGTFGGGVDRIGELLNRDR